MQLRVISDLHVDRHLNLPFKHWVSSDDKHRVLVIAGDICSISRPNLMKETLSFFGKHFKAVLVLLGNHEYYHRDILKTPDTMQAIIQSLKMPNIHLLHQSHFYQDGVLIIGATLWTDLLAYQKPLEQKAHFKLRFLFSQRAKPVSAKMQYDIMQSLFENQKKWLFEVLKNYQDKVDKKVVVSHHAPSFLSINPKFKEDANYYLYASHLDKEIKQLSPSVWLHGHTHAHCDYKLGQTQVIANPFGFPGERTGFLPKYLLHI